MAPRKKKLTKKQKTARKKRECVVSMNTAINGVAVTNTFAQGIIKVGSSEYRYFFIYN